MLITATQDVQSAARELAKIVPLAVIKLGAEGALARRADETWSSPALKLEVVDPVGAGDSYNAGFLHEYLKGSEIKSCMAAGNLAGALSITRAGGTEAFRDAEYRERFLREHRGLVSG